MTCINCHIHSGQFTTEKDYKNFLNNLNVLIESGIIKKIKNANQNSPFFEEEYVCTQCKQIGLLAVPDQAFRGGWNAK